MNRAGRLPYLALTNIAIPILPPGEEAYTCLCSWCRYAEGLGDCYEPEFACRHPLWVIEEVAGNVSEHCDGDGQGADCWGFSPLKGIDPETAADMVGIWLQGKGVEVMRIP